MEGLADRHLVQRLIVYTIRFVLPESHNELPRQNRYEYHLKGFAQIQHKLVAVLSVEFALMPV